MSTQQIIDGWEQGVEPYKLGGVCPICKRHNDIVNQCRCDPNNLPTPISWAQTIVNAAAEGKKIMVIDASDYPTA